MFKPAFVCELTTWMKKGATLISIQMITLGTDLAVCSPSHPGQRILGINYVNRFFFASHLTEMGDTIGLLLITDKACCLGLNCFSEISCQFQEVGEQLEDNSPIQRLVTMTIGSRNSPQCQQREQQDRLNFKQRHAASHQDVERGTSITNSQHPPAINHINTSGLHRTTATPENGCPTPSQGALTKYLKGERHI